MEYSVKFSENCPKELRATILDCFKSAGLICELVNEDKNIIHVSATFKALVDQV